MLSKTFTKKLQKCFWGETIMWRTRYETEQLIANMYPHCYMKNATKTHITCMFFLTHNTDETISSFKRLSANLCGFYLFHSCSVKLLSPKNTCVLYYLSFFVLFFLLVLFNFHWVLRALTAFLYLLMFSWVTVCLTSQGHHTLGQVSSLLCVAGFVFINKN